MTARLPNLDKLLPTIESTALKLAEETGEFSRVVTRFRGMSGEEKKPDSVIARELENELVDVQQVAATLERLLDIDVESAREDHLVKMIGKGYMSKPSELSGKIYSGLKIKIYHGRPSGALSDFVDYIYMPIQTFEDMKFGERGATKTGAAYKLNDDQQIVLLSPLKDVEYEDSDNFIVIGKKFVPIRDKVVQK